MEFQLDVQRYSDELQEIKDLRTQMKERSNTLKEIRQDIYNHMDEHNLETFAVGEHLFKKQIRKKCPWNKKTLQLFAEDGTVNLTEYEERNTEETVVYSSKKRKLKT
jgi:hypothetical protein|tara:strand:- start:1140 stop:1460 length:321 start_codon:yes stop_codon:yes gene_type:complete